MADEPNEYRASTHAQFWDERYEQRVELFGAGPNAFIREATRDLPPESRVLDLAAGEGRNAAYLARQGHHVTALDFSKLAVERLQRKQRAFDLDIHVIEADVLEWEPENVFDCIVITFLQLLPDQRPELYRRVQEWLAPGGRCVGLFFRPEQITEHFPSGGPPTLDRMITVDELRRHFPEKGIQQCEATEMMLQEGILAGPGAVIQFRFDQPGAVFRE